MPSVVLVLALLSIACASSVFDSNCTGPVAFVTAYTNPTIVLVNQPIRYENYEQLCRQNGYRPLKIRDDRELKTVLKELQSLHCHHGPAWIDRYWRVHDKKGKKTPTAVNNDHGGLLEFYQNCATATYPVLCRAKKYKPKHHKKDKKTECKKTKGRKTKCKKTRRSHCASKRSSCKGRRAPAKCLKRK